jgi:predicted dithiol-disulfide oxidoreductase (DUF899 family)
MAVNEHQIATAEQWLVMRKQLLEKEKAFTRAREELAQARRDLAWERVEKSYVFDGPRGQESLGDLFEGRSQLIVYHFMFGPSAEVGCKSCSFWADNFNAAVPHLAARDATLVAISRAPLALLEAFKKRLGWSFKWVSSGRNDFNFDLNVSFRERDQPSGNLVYNYAPIPKSPVPGNSKGGEWQSPGVSVFYKDQSGAVFHTYSTYGRGLDALNGTYQFMDLLPKGRDEAALPFPQSWVRFHDEYPHSA